MDLSKQTAIVTGAGRGIGRAIAERLAQEGAQVVVSARTETQLRETEAAIRERGGKALAIPADVLDRGAVDELVRRAEAEFGPVTLLVNNAARFHCIGPVWEVDTEDWWQDITVNILGVMNCCQAVLAGMRARGAGRIINLIGGGTGGPFKYGSGYGTSKAAVMRFTECLAQELEEETIAVFALGPGLVRTEMTEYQVISEAGKRWLPQINEMFDQQKDVPPTQAAEITAQLASGRFDRLSGRAFFAGEEMEATLNREAEILAQDLKTLRMRE